MCLYLMLTWKPCASDRSRAIASSHLPNTAVSPGLTPDLEKFFSLNGHSSPVPSTKGITSSFEKDNFSFRKLEHSFQSHSFKPSTNILETKREKIKVCFLSEDSSVTWYLIKLRIVPDMDKNNILKMTAHNKYLFWHIIYRHALI